VAIVTVAVVMTSKQAPSTLDITSWFVEWVPQSPSFEEGTAQYDALEWLISEIDVVGEYDEENQLQLFSLAVLYFSTDGDNWIKGGRDWLSGIVDERLISKLDLSENNLQGRIPAEIGLLSSTLAYLDLNSNSLIGQVPSEIGLLTKLTWLDLGRNSITGVPSEIVSLAKLSESFLSCCIVATTCVAVPNA
jgi:hypothetical protein